MLGIRKHADDNMLATGTGYSRQTKLLQIDAQNRPQALPHPSMTSAGSIVSKTRGVKLTAAPFFFPPLESMTSLTFDSSCPPKTSVAESPIARTLASRYASIVSSLFALGISLSATHTRGPIRRENVHWVDDHTHPGLTMIRHRLAAV